jgi:hypothetical protein
VDGKEIIEVEGKIMKFKKAYRIIILFILLASSLVSCTTAPTDTVSTSTPPNVESTPTLPANTPIPSAAILQASAAPAFITDYEFPDSIDPAKQYLFYLHGKIIEDQGIPAISPDYGEYEYEAILESLSGYGFVVISEQRPKNADGVKYAKRTAKQVIDLLEAGVPAKNITVVGVSKGSYIAIYVSHFLENEEVNFVILGSCYPDEVEILKQNQIFLHGNVLSIYDSVDIYAGSCKELFSLSESHGGLSRHEEIVLNVGTGHGILYKPLDEWILPTVEWAGKP